MSGLPPNFDRDRERAREIDEAEAAGPRRVWVGTVTVTATVEFDADDEIDHSGDAIGRVTTMLHNGSLQFDLDWTGEMVEVDDA